MPTIQDWLFTYPQAPEQRLIEVLQTFVYAVNGSTSAIKKAILAFVQEHTKDRGQMTPSLAFWMELALEEALVNIPKHDMLNIHGTDIEIFNTDDWGTRHDEFVEKIYAAQGLKSTIRVEIHDRGISYSYTLSRPFPNFRAKWENARLEEPDQEDLEKACGRGLLLMGQFFDEGIYDDDALTLTFNRQWKEDDFTPATEGEKSTSE